jgi:deoxycytidylate deaminase
LKLISKTDKSFLSVARYFAAKSKSRNTHGAVVVKSGRVLGTGFNKDRNSPKMTEPARIKTDCSFHAEEIAIRDAGENIKGAKIYVARVNRHGSDRDSRPCPKCLLLIRSVGIKKIIYTSEEGIHVSH